MSELAVVHPYVFCNALPSQSIASQSVSQSVPELYRGLGSSAAGHDGLTTNISISLEVKFNLQRNEEFKKITFCGARFHCFSNNATSRQHYTSPVFSPCPNSLPF